MLSKTVVYRNAVAGCWSYYIYLWCGLARSAHLRGQAAIGALFSVLLSRTAYWRLNID
jgi:hypothetical protein